MHLVISKATTAAAGTDWDCAWTQDYVTRTFAGWHSARPDNRNVLDMPVL